MLLRNNRYMILRKQMIDGLLLAIPTSCIIRKDSRNIEIDNTIHDNTGVELHSQVASGQPTQNLFFLSFKRIFVWDNFFPIVKTSAGRTFSNIRPATTKVSFGRIFDSLIYG